MPLIFLNKVLNQLSMMLKRNLWHCKEIMLTLKKIRKIPKKLLMNFMMLAKSLLSMRIKPNSTHWEVNSIDLESQSMLDQLLLRKTHHSIQTDPQMNLDSIADTSKKPNVKEKILSWCHQPRDSTADSRLMLNVSKKHMYLIGFWISGPSSSPFLQLHFASLKMVSLTDFALGQVPMSWT